MVGGHRIAAALKERLTRALSPARRRAARALDEGRTLLDSGAAEQALTCFQRAVALLPHDAAAQHGLGLALRAAGRHAEAQGAFQIAVRLDPRHIEAHYKLGNTLLALGRPDAALVSFDAALALAPAHVDALYNRGLALQALQRPAEALASYDRVLALTPGDAETLNNRGNALLQLRRPQEALSSYLKALKASPRYPHSHFNAAVALLELKQPERAAAALENLLTLEPDYPFARGKLLHAAMLACAWQGFEERLAAVLNALRQGERAIDPFALQGVCDDPALLRRCAQIETALHHPPRPALTSHRHPGAGGRIRIGYVSGEFRQQATSVLLAELIERHNRARFEIVAFDNGWDDGSAMRQRLVAAFDRMVDIARLDDDRAAAAVAAQGIDILVDLNGFFGLARQGVFARRPARVQVNFLGFPGTLGAPYMDYIVADAQVLPMDQAEHVVERIVHLPDCYQPNDRKRAIAARTPSRAELGLPDDAFVFCCFNNNYKITPVVFDVWMQLLAQVDASVLWLLKDNDDALRNLRAAAQRCGVAPERLVFAPRLALDVHLARLRQADLFLDTAPSNAHTTASDALWSGLPVITFRGRGFSARVAASLLQAAGLPELVTNDLCSYGALALALARDRPQLAALRARLAAQRDRCALFDTDAFARHIESAYATMHARARRGEPPQAFSVPRLA